MGFRGEIVVNVEAEGEGVVRVVFTESQQPSIIQRLLSLH
jgi:hypothetical protein